MGDATRCKACGAEVPGGDLAGLCPTCLLRQGLAGASESAAVDGDADITVAVGPADPSTLARLGDSLGPMPSVLLRDGDPESAPEPVVAPASPEMPRPGDRTGKLQLFGEIARGGMGAVLKARDPDLGRELAVKVLLERHRDKPELVRRFIEEAQIGGQLQHPGIVPVYDLGAFADARPYFAMKLVRGRTLAALLGARPSPADDLPRFLSIFEAVCQTVAYAHARGVIHRDLKPSNVMVGSFGEVQVMDWGLAKVLARGGVADERRSMPAPADSPVATGRSGSAADESHAGSVMGTPPYMPPEQARGETDRLDERADVFALGSILCEVLTGGPAHAGSSSAEVLRKAAAADTADAESRLAACGADPELAALVRSCLAPSVEARPRDARAVADAVTAHLAGVQGRLRDAELASARAQARAEAERTRRRLAIGLAASVLIAVGLGLSGWLWNASRRRATERRFESALAEASARLGTARGSGGDASAWAAARAAADDLAALAGTAGLNADLAASISRLRDEAASEAEAVAAAARAARRDRELMAALASAQSMRPEFGEAGTIDALRSTLADAGLVLDDGREPALAVRALAGRPEAVRVAAAAGLDDWSALARTSNPGDESAWRRPLALAEALDPEPTRQAVRHAWAGGDRDALLRLAAPESVDRLRPASVALLAGAIRDAGGLHDPAAAAVLRRGLLRHPRDVRLNEALGQYLAGQSPEGKAEAIAYYATARALEPASGHLLAHLLADRGRADEAEAIFRELAEEAGGNPVRRARHLSCLGGMLRRHGRPKEAETALEESATAARAALRLAPDNPNVHLILGNTLRSQARWEPAVAEYREALRLRPEFPEARANLADALREQGRTDRRPPPAGHAD
ncbi:Serine/threonine-protein kinase PknB [Aquisphaera giovannonii]|uniref:Serine/threonine-protein kinase PknB n=1 Tax=Aquisphaera giovannonii TaxID=406548 RepID=A0A5B9VST6_9BACT|nr:protein kinase [Aquisphaera giovannonii]QEH31556.1 Serine/threonine-protein kinase PknB [Aquisphaera giovannonii]